MKNESVFASAARFQAGEGRWTGRTIWWSREGNLGNLKLGCKPQGISWNLRHKRIKTTMTGRAEKRKASTGLQPPKKRTLSPKTSSPIKPRRKRKDKKRTVTEEQHTSHEETTTSSPPKTPKRPSGALKLGLNKGTAKSLKHGSKITPVYNMLYEFAQIVVEKQLRSEEEFKPILEELAGKLINLPSSVSSLSFFLSFFPLFPSLTLRIPNCWKEKHFLQYLNVNSMLYVQRNQFDVHRYDSIYRDKRSSWQHQAFWIVQRTSQDCKSC